MSASIPKVQLRIYPYTWGYPGHYTNWYGYTYDALLSSLNHRRLPNGGWSGGGPFYCVHKHSLLHNHRSVRCIRNGVDYGSFLVYQGSIAGLSNPNPAPSANPTYASHAVDMQPDYVKGYARTRPGNPVAGLGQFLVELRELPQRPFKRLFSGTVTKKRRLEYGFGTSNIKRLYRNDTPLGPVQTLPQRLYNELRDFKNLGSEYLNIVFGWKPFVKDLQDMYYLWQTIDKRIAQLIRENGKGIRRKATVKNDISTSQTTQTYGFAYANCTVGPPSIPGGVTHFSSVTRTTERRWYVAKYQYYIPDTSSSLWDARARIALFGANPTPELLWNVLPWTWLIDWFTNIGDVISNLSGNAVDNLTTKYSFTMKHITSETTYVSHVYHPASSTPSNLWDGVDFPFTSTTFSESKLRVGGGNPFGLNVTLPSLSIGQLGILGALGLSRSSVK